MTKEQVKQGMKGKIIAVIRNEDTEIARAMCHTIVSAGINTLEITFSVKEAVQLISELKKELPDVIIGAGTVFSKQQAVAACENGADFIGTPCIIEEVGEYCKENKVFCSLGAATPTEVFRAYQLGCDVVKLFPSDSISPKIIKGIKVAMPFIELIPIGGVDDTNIKEWFDCGAFAADGGGYLTRGIDKTNLDKLKRRCDKLIRAFC